MSEEFVPKLEGFSANNAAMMSAMRREEFSMEPMVSTTWRTTSPPFAATPEAVFASSLASRAWPAFWFTAPVSSRTAPLMRSSVSACASVRAERSELPCAISAEAA